MNAEQIEHWGESNQCS